LKIKTPILLIMLFLSACSLLPPAAQPTPNPEVLGTEIDAIVQANYEAGVFDGSVLVAQNGQVIISKGYGYADREHKIPNTPETRFPIASISKQFTAMAIMLLQEQGKLSVQDSLCDFVPDCPQEFEPVKLHHLLTHSSGVPAKTLWYKPGNEMLPESATLYFQPGERFMYSNIGYALLDRVIETASGQSYESFLQKNIFDPLEMTNTGVAEQSDGLANGYKDAQSDFAVVFPYGLVSEYLVYSTIEDFYRYDQALYGEELLPQSALSAMFESQMAVPDGKYYGGEDWSYGYGWFIAPDQLRYILHGGMLAGYRTEIRRYTDDKITIIQLCNQEAVALYPTAEAIASKLLGNGTE
jgi:CubicO group peptidase (beta-lactamase class C family)